VYQEYKDRAAFYVVYIEEAHASDGWQTPSNLREKVIVANPGTLEARRGVAQSCVTHLKIQVPALLDDIGDTTEALYTGWPDRLYVIDRGGHIAYKSRPGPFGFKPEEMTVALARAVSIP
jgi:type I thyroxine 5'-deiodinase